MKPIVTLYNILGINRSIEDKHLRLLYLKEVWGLPQHLISECEGIGQPTVSQTLKEAYFKHGSGDITELKEITYTEEEIKSIQLLPRTIIKDLQVMSFVNNILGIEVDHPFYEKLNTTLRIVALNSLGVQQKHIAKIFNRTQSSISMTIHRTNENVLDREFYYRDKLMHTFKFKPKKQQTTLIQAGGYGQQNTTNWKRN